MELVDWHGIGGLVVDWQIVQGFDLIGECFLGWLGLDRHGGVNVVLRRDTSVGPYSVLVPCSCTGW